jgi:hypothetical protein
MSKGGANSISLGMESTPPNDDQNPFISTFCFPIDFLGKSAKKFFVDFIFVFPHPPLKLKQIDRKSSTAFNDQLHRCGSFSPHDRVIDWRHGVG